MDTDVRQKSAVSSFSYYIDSPLDPFADTNSQITAVTTSNPVKTALLDLFARGRNSSRSMSTSFSLRLGSI